MKTKQYFVLRNKPATPRGEDDLSFFVLDDVLSYV